MKGLTVVLQHRASQATETQRTEFHLPQIPAFSISAYIDRVSEFFECSDACLVLALVYIDRATLADPNLVISDLTVHQLLCTSLMMAAKFFDDEYYSTKVYANVGGMSSRRLAKLELRLLQLLDWKLGVESEEYTMYRDLLLESACECT